MIKVIICVKGVDYMKLVAIVGQIQLVQQTVSC